MRTKPTIVLDVCSDGDFDCWVAYTVSRGLAFRIHRGSLDELREYARCNGYSGIVVGTPSVPWSE